MYLLYDAYVLQNTQVLYFYIYLNASVYIKTLQYRKISCLSYYILGKSIGYKLILLIV